MTIRAIIVDDEPLARTVVREFLQPHTDVAIIGECETGFDAVKMIVQEKPDLVFLDIQMPRLTGFEVLDLLREELPAVVFVTAYDEFALRAFEVHAVDYLLKPFEQQRLDTALGRVRERLVSRNPIPLEPLLADARASAPLQRVVVRDRTEVHVIPVDTIDFLEAQDDYVAVHVAGSTRLKQDRLATLAEKLDPRRFVRVHRSYVVNVDRLARIELYARDSRVLLLKDGTKIPLSREGYRRLKGLL